MSGGAWQYYRFKLDEAAEEMASVYKLLSEVEYCLDWGYSGDSCYECSKVQVIGALESWFARHGNKDYDQPDPFDILRGNDDGYRCDEHKLTLDKGKASG